jgi:hypothetical protein
MKRGSRKGEKSTLGECQLTAAEDKRQERKVRNRIHGFGWIGARLLFSGSDILLSNFPEEENSSRDSKEAEWVERIQALAQELEAKKEAERERLEQELRLEQRERERIMEEQKRRLEQEQQELEKRLRESEMERLSRELEEQRQRLEQERLEEELRMEKNEKERISREMEEQRQRLELERERYRTLVIKKVTLKKRNNFKEAQEGSVRYGIFL